MKNTIRWFTIVITLVASILLTGCEGLTPVPVSTATPENLSIAVTPAAHPQIVQKNLLPGESLGLSPDLEMVFDRPMQQDKTAAAWQFLDKDGNSIKGKITWADAQTFRFKPDGTLKPGQKYTAIFSVGATAADGSALTEPVQIEYRTTDELAIGQVFPVDRSEDVDNKTAITVIFNKPVVPLMTIEEQSALPAPIAIQPETKGAGSWVSSSVYVFQPEAGLKSGTQYHVQVRRDLKDTSGVPLSKALDWSFSTRSPVVVEFDLKDFGKDYHQDVSDVKLDQAFEVIFSQPMDQKSVSDALFIRNVETGRDLPVKLSWDTDSTILTITPSVKMEVASFYRLVISELAEAQDGGNLKEPYEIKISTVALPSIVSVIPEGGKQEYFSSFASVNFNTQMKSESMKGRVKVLPEPKNPVKLIYNEYLNRLDIIGLEPSSEYVIRILPGMADVYGNTIKTEYSFSVITAGLSPMAHMVTPGYPLIYRQKSEQALYFEYTNLKSAKISLYQLTFDEFKSLTAGGDDNLFASSGKLVREWPLDLKAEKDRFTRILLKMDDKGSLEPGYYYLGLTADPLKPERRFWQGATFIISNHSLALKATLTEALAWLVDSETGEPVANSPLVFYNETWMELGKGVTDSHGLFQLPDTGKVEYVQSVDPAHLALAALSWGSGVTQGQSGIWTDYWSPPQTTFVYTYTERSLYRPNQPVFIKGIVRSNDDLHYSLPELNQVYLSIENDQGKVFEGYVDLSKNGTFTSEYQLSADAPVGNYNISIRKSPGSEDALSWAYFRVAEYVKPEFQVTASVDHPIALNGDEVKFSLDASYYSGGSLGNANVSWFMETHPYFYQPPQPYDGYSFNDYDYYDYYYNGGNSSSGPPVFKDGQGQTDDKGHFEMVEVMELPNEGESQQVAFSANVTDVGGNLVGSSTNLTVLGSALHAGIRPENYVGKAGEEQKFNLVVLDVDGKPVANQAVSVALVEQQWFSVERKDENGLSRWETSVKSIPVGTASATTDEDGLATVSFIPAKGGEYKATITASDELGRPAKGAAYLWVSSDAYISWRQTNDRSFQLVADKSSYYPGETAKILIAQPFEGENNALITTERGHIYEKEVVKLKTNSTLYELPITSDMAPVMYVSVMVVKGADGLTPPDFKMGMLRININPARQNILVSLQSDKVSARPGDSVTYTVKTKDLDGKPVQADVSLALVDKAVLALAPSNSIPLLEAFYPQRGLGVISASSIVLNAEDFNANYAVTEPTGERAGGGGKGEGDNGIVTVRQNFKDTAFWQGQVLTDETGTAQVTVTLPDNLTTWQMEARAVTNDTRVGETKSELLSTRPLQIQLQTPRFFVVDDRVTLGGVVHNNTETTLMVKVSLQEAKGLKLSSAAIQTVSVAAGQQAYVTWDAVVERSAQRVDLIASVESGSYADSTRPTLGTLPGQGLPVLAYRVTETVGSAGILRDAGSTTETILLPKINADSYLDATLNLNISPSLAASTVDGLSYLTDYPYLCMEQTVSRFLPNLLSLEALKQAGKASNELQKSLDEQVQPALQRIISNQNADGGWGLWPGTESQPTTTAYVIEGLFEARKAGYSVPAATEEQGVAYLTSNLSYLYYSNDTWENNRAAFILYVLARSGHARDNNVSTLYASRDKLDIYGNALLLQAMHYSDPKDERIKTIISEINDHAAVSAAGVWWNEKDVDYRNWNTDVRTTAIVLDALIQADPQNALIANGIRWLMKHREGNHWYSTQETAWSLMALTDWLVLSGEFQTNYQFAVGFNGELLKTGQADAAHLTETIALRLGVEKFVTDQANHFVLTRGDGPGVLYYTSYMDYSLPVENIQPLDQGIMISQQYFRPDDLKTPVTEVKRGELLQVRVTLVAPQSLHYLVIDNPLPAGLEALDTSLLTSQQAPTQYQSSDYDRYGWGWWYFYYKQIYDEKVVMSADYLPAGTYTITYLARASTAGDFHVLPTTAKEFYFPDVAGRSASAELVVKP